VIAIDPPAGQPDAIRLRVGDTTLRIDRDHHATVDELAAEAIQIRDDILAGLPPTDGPWCHICRRPMWVHHPAGPDEFCDCTDDPRGPF
jgi:hypothetical protein